MKVIVSSAYWPNVEYLAYLLHAEEVTVEGHEHFQKQSYRTRCSILSANGVLNLSLPVLHTQSKMKMQEVELSYKENWQIKHWRAITSAYKNSPYFDFFEEEVSAFYTKSYKHLLDFNLAQIQLIGKLLRHSIPVTISQTYVKSPESVLDLRERLHPKKEPDAAVMRYYSSHPYYQTFGEKFAFVPNLSCLDLLFNTGLESKAYVRELYHQALMRQL